MSVTESGPTPVTDKPVADTLAELLVSEGSRTSDDITCTRLEYALSDAIGALAWLDGQSDRAGYVTTLAELHPDGEPVERAAAALVTLAGWIQDAVTPERDHGAASPVTDGVTGERQYDSTSGVTAEPNPFLESARQFVAEQRAKTPPNVCEVCGSEFRPCRPRREVARYCSPACRQKAYRRRKGGTS